MTARRDKSMVVFESALLDEDGGKTYGEPLDMIEFSGECALQLNALADHDNPDVLTFSVEHSHDGISGWVDSGLTFDDLVIAGAAYRVVPLNVDKLHRYIRLVYTLTDTGSTDATSNVESRTLN